MSHDSTNIVCIHNLTNNVHKTSGRRSMVLASLLCLSLPILGGCAAAGVASLFNSDRNDALGFANNSDGGVVATPGGTVTLPAYFVSGSATFDGAGLVTGSSFAGSSINSVSVDFDDNSDPSALVIGSRSSSTTFSAASISEAPSIEGYPVLSGLANDGRSTFASVDFGDYVSFGIWVSPNATGTLVTASAFYVGGDETLSSSLPPSGQAIYRGRTAGLYASTFDGSAVTRATLTGSIDFGNRTIGLSTSDSFGTLLPSGFEVASPLINWSGNGTISGGTFSGALTQNNGASGSFSGHFFGPSGEGIGGVFNSTAPDGIHYGAFGAVR